MHPARGTKDVTETAHPCPRDGRRSRTQRGRGPRFLLALGAAALLAVLPLASAPAVGSILSAAAGASSVAPVGRLSVVDAPATASRTSAPALRAKKPPRRHSDRASIGLFTAMPATLPSAGGTVHLLAVVASATTCRFSASKALKRLPATERCSSGRVSIDVKLPKNSTASTRTYDFQLVASGLHGAATAAPVAVLERASPAATAAPSITGQPASESVIAGSNVTFTAAAAGAASVQWQVSTGAGAAWSEIAGATDDSYSFVAALGDSGYEYRALFSYRGHSAVSDAATLTVSPASSGNAPQGGQGAVSGADATEAPLITLQPLGDGVVTQTTATFTAQALGTPTPSVQWQVSTDGSTWVDIAGATSTTYSFTATVSENGDKYRAVFTNSAGTATTIAASLAVVVERVPPNVTTEPQSQSVAVGEQVTFTAAASGGVPAATVQWEVSVDEGDTWSPIGGATSTTYSFTVTDLSENGYEYRAEFINSDIPAEAVDTEAAVLTVSEPAAPTVTEEPIPYPVGFPAYVGSTASFTATASGLPAPTVQWEVSTVGVGGPYTAIPGATSTTYAFDPTLGQSGDYYEAVFSNLAGTATSDPALLTVSVPLAAPTITEQPVSQAVIAGGSATFTAAAAGNPTPTVAWQVSTDGGDTWGNVSGATSSSYGLFATTSGESGWQYRAVFTNTQGSVTTDPVTLTVGSDSDSYDNWSGYVATGGLGAFDTVTGDWTVPSATCHAGATSYSAEWIGIDGFTSDTVEQDGTDSDCASGTPNYYAWYELYPAASITISSGSSYPVAPGDSMSASVRVSGFTWTLEISDLTAGWSFSFVQADSGLDQNSAEWIAERPELCAGDCSDPILTSLADFGSVTFSDATANGESLSALAPTSIQMTSKNSSALLALAGPLSGSSFTDTWYGSN
jgi:peptidase A4-like protein